MTETLKELRTARGLSQSRLGIAQDYASAIELGKLTPGPNAIRKLVIALNAADSGHLVTPVQVMDACRESQRRAAEAAAESATTEPATAGAK